MSAELVLEETFVDEVTNPAVTEGSLGQFCRRILTRLILIWVVLMLFSYQFYLLREKQILAHPVEAFAWQTGMEVQAVIVGVMVDLPNIRTFADLKPKLIRAGRLMGLPPDAGVLEARMDPTGPTLSWVATDKKGRQSKIIGSILENGTAKLLIEMTHWGPEPRITESSREVLLTACRFGKVSSSHVQVEGIVDDEDELYPEKCVQAWRLVDFEVIRVGSTIQLKGMTADLAQSRRRPVAFTLDFVPYGKTRGHISLTVKTR
jgi:hypothetical protein